MFGFWYLLLIPFKWVIGAIVFIVYDWWMAIIKKMKGKGHVWKCKGWFVGTKKIYTADTISGHNSSNLICKNPELLNK